MDTEETPWGFGIEPKYQDSNKSKRMNKTVDQFRNFEDNLQTERIKQLYKDKHRCQTVETVKEKRKAWMTLNNVEMSVMDALRMLDNYTDPSDPDTDLPCSVHCFQTADKINKEHRDKDWFQLTGLIHDLGKIMAIWCEPHHFVVGDTYPVGCKFQPSIIFYENFKKNPDTKKRKYKSQYGIYEPHCGLDRVIMSWGHGEYLYHVLQSNKCTLPEEAMYIIRYHSFYALYESNDYHFLTDERDQRLIPWLKEFRKYNLYSKSDEINDGVYITPYFETLIEKYCPGKLRW